MSAIERSKLQISLYVFCPCNEPHNLPSQNIEDLRKQLRDVIDSGGYQKLVVFSAGMGFLAGAYEVFKLKTFNYLDFES